MNFLVDTLKRLTSKYQKSPSSNIGKLFAIVAGQIEDAKTTLEKIVQYRDIDQAVGVPLDRIGRNVLEFRGNLTDDHFRNLIKTKIRANLSGGEIETMNEIAEVLLGNAFDGVVELWSLTNHPKAGEPAAMLLYLNTNLRNLPHSSLKRVTAGGVALYFQVSSETEAIEYCSDKKQLVTVGAYQICGTFSAGGEYEL